MAKSDAPSGPAETPLAVGVAGFAGVGSAAQQARRRERFGDPENEDRGGDEDLIAGGPPPPDSDNPDPQGLQAEEAQFTTNGSVAGNMIPSPTGPVPVALVAGSPEEAEEVLARRREALEEEKQRLNPDRRFEEDEVAELDGGTLRALGARRGYEMPGAGTRAAQKAFLRQQDTDPNYNSASRRRTKASAAAEPEA